MLGLWLRPGQPHPHEYLCGHPRGGRPRRAETSLLPQVVTAAVLDVALNITRVLDAIRALTRAWPATLRPVPTPTGRPSTSCTRTPAPSC